MNKCFFYSLFLFLLVISGQIVGQGTSCNVAEPFCTGVTYGFPMNTNTSAESGPNYGCLGSQPNPVWYYMLIDQPGDITVHMVSPTGNDIDFAAWGPFNSPTGPCVSQLTATGPTPTDCPANNNPAPAGSYPAGNMVDCSFDVNDIEDLHLSNALTGQYYMLCITNYSNAPGDIVFSQSNVGAPGAGSTDCSIVTPCDITSATANPSACTPGTNAYSVSGTIVFNDAPATGQLTISDNGGASQTINAPFTSPFNYNLTGLNSDATVHTVTIQFSDDQFCNYTVTYTAPGPCSNCSANAGPDLDICGLSTNMAAVTQAGDYNFQWTGPAGITFSPANSPTALVTATTSGTYVLTWTITNSLGLTCSDNMTVIFTANPTSTFTVTNINCFGNNSTITYTGSANAGATYTWSFNGGTIVSGTGAGPYQVNWGTAGLQTITLQVSDNHCLSPVTSIQVNNPPDLLYNVLVDPIACPGSAGSVTPVTSGGTPAYSYAWSNVVGPPFSSGNYTSTVTDALGCTETFAFTVTAPNNITLLPNQTNLTCNGNFSGSATITASGGTPPYGYTWTGGVSTTSVASNLAAGNYTVTVIDDNGCTVTNAFIITEPAVVNLQTTSTINTSCSGMCNGSATVSGSGGMPGPFSYLWSTGDLTPTAANLCAGVYTVTTADANLCTASTSITITEPVSIIASVTNTTNATCFGLCNGSGTVGAINGTLPYSFVWPSGTGGPTATNLCVGSYVVTASDANGCSTTTTVTINEPTELVATTSNIVSVNCFGGCDGSATITGSGGQGPYSYNWNSGTINAQVNNSLCAGTHFVTVTDASGCTATSVAMVPQPTQLTINGITVTDVSCNGADDASISVGILGGIGDYTFALGNQSDTVGLFTGLGGGLYTVTVTDSRGCTVTGSTTVDEPSPLSVSAIPTHSICNGEWAYLTATATGGTQPYVYYWDTVQSNASIGVHPTVTTGYSVNVTDVNGCTSNTFNVLVNVSPPLLVNLVASPSSICPGDSVQLSVSMTQGGGPPYTVYTSDGTVVIPPTFITPQSSGLQWLFVEDGCGSVGHDSVYITVSPLPVVNFMSDTTSGCEPLTVAFTPMNPQAGLTYYWNFGDGSYNQLSYDMNPVHLFSQDGVFDVSLTITNSEGCYSTYVHQDMIHVFPGPDARFIPDPNGASIIHPQIHFINYSELASSYVWSFGDGDSSSIESPWHWYSNLGSYVVQLIAITDMGCADTASSTIVIRDEYTFYAPTAISPDFDDNNDVFFVLGNGISTNDFQLFVYDRWGEIIYQTDKYDPEQPWKYGWDGSVKGGDIAPVGSYTWLVKYVDGDRIKHDRSGVVNVIR